MKRHAPLLLALFVLAWTPLASAQNAISDNLTVYVEGDKLDNAQYVWIGQAQCKKGVTFKFDAVGYTKTVKVLELWATNSASTDCSAVTSRQSSAMMKAPCWLVDTETNVQPNEKVSLSGDATKLFSAEGAGKCDPATNLPYTVYLVPLPSATTPGTSMAPEPLTTEAVRKAVFTLYTEAPDEPTGIKGISGESSIGVDWKAPGSADMNTSYRVYYDIAQDGTGDVECGSGALIPGEAPPATSATIISEKEGSEGGSLSGLDGKVEIGQSVAVGVVTVDAGGNKSKLSDVICVERVETDGFLKLYEDQGGKGLDKCSVHAPGRVGWGSLGCLTVLGLTLVSRRRRAA